jgi:hypothetical protein
MFPIENLLLIAAILLLLSITASKALEGWKYQLCCLITKQHAMGSEGPGGIYLPAPTTVEEPVLENPQPNHSFANQEEKDAKPT